MAQTFRYEDKEQITLPNPMSIDKSVVRTTLLPSLMNVYQYNKSHGVEDVSIYEIAKTYDKKYNDLILELPLLFPDADFVFRPHPLLFTVLDNEGLWTTDKIDKYIATLKS